MNIDRREFLRRGGLLAVFGALPKAVTVGANAAKEHVLKVYRKTCNVPVDVPKFDARTGIPIIDLWLSIDHPRQRLACTCEYSLDGQCVRACAEGRRLIQDVADAGADLWAVVAKHASREGQSDIRVAWEAYRDASADYRRHYCAGWVEGKGDE